MALASVIAVVVTMLAFSETRRHDEAAIVGLSSPIPESELKVLEAAADSGNPDAQSRLAHEISRFQGPGIRAFQLLRRFWQRSRTRKSLRSVQRSVLADLSVAIDEGTQLHNPASLPAVR